MPGHTTDTLIDFEKVKDLEKKPSAEIGPLLKYRDIPRTKNNSLPNYSITPQPNIISYGLCESQASDGTPTSQISLILWNPTSDHHKNGE